MPEITSRFDSKCAYCHQAIIKGSRCIWVPNLKKGVTHISCFEQLKKEGKTIQQIVTGNSGSSSSQSGDSQLQGSSSSDSKESSPKNDFDFKLEPDGSESKQNTDSITREQLSGFLRDAQKTLDKNSSRAMSRLTMTNEQIEKKLEQAAQKSMEESVKKYAQKVVEVQQPDKEPVRIEGAHKDLDQLIELISNRPREHTYAWGPPGSGKSTGALHAARALSMDYAYISLNPQTPESRLLGFIDANGVYRPTPFRKIYENGGVFCIDELDNASPSLLTTLNGCLENGTAAFPDTMVDCHEDFVVVATGNTSGRGGDQFFPERRPFDAAFAERFSFLFWDYDEQLERQIALSFNPNAEAWVDWVQTVRKYCKENLIRLTVSPRASIKGAKQTRLKAQNVETLTERVLFKGLHKDDKNRILQNCGQPPEVKPYG